MMSGWVVLLVLLLASGCSTTRLGVGVMPIVHVRVAQTMKRAGLGAETS